MLIKIRPTQRNTLETVKVSYIPNSEITTVHILRDVLAN